MLIGPIAITKVLRHERPVLTTELPWISEQHQNKQLFSGCLHNQVRVLGISFFRCATATIFVMRRTSAFRTRCPKSVSR